MQSSGRTGEKINFCRDLKVPVSNLARVSLCACVSNLSGIDQTFDQSDICGFEFALWYSSDTRYREARRTHSEIHVAFIDLWTL